MERLITDKAILHDIDAIDAQIKKLQAERDDLKALLRNRTGKTPTGRKPKLNGGKAAYREAVYNALTTDGQTITEVADRASVGHAAALRYLKQLRNEGLAAELTGQRKYQRWVRNVVKIKPGEPVGGAEDGS